MLPLLQNRGLPPHTPAKEYLHHMLLILHLHAVCRKNPLCYNILLVICLCLPAYIACYIFLLKTHLTMPAPSSPIFLASSPNSWFSGLSSWLFLMPAFTSLIFSNSSCFRSSRTGSKSSSTLSFVALSTASNSTLNTSLETCRYGYSVTKVIQNDLKPKSNLFILAVNDHKRSLLEQNVASSHLSCGNQSSSLTLKLRYLNSFSGHLKFLPFLGAHALRKCPS